jgi:TonB-linked SusC/RagA family outer membrane protein
LFFSLFQPVIRITNLKLKGMNKKLALIKKMGGVLLLLLIFSLNVVAQVQVRGVVLDELGDPAIGATIQIKGTAQGTVTDMDGYFTISAPAGGTLVISYVGYATQEVAVSANVRVHLQLDSELLDELVVVGYGVMRRSDLTGSVSRTSGEDIARGQSFSALAGLTGRAAGVNIFANTGQPGGEMRVIIRGISTITASTRPLFVVDGVVMSYDGFLLLNPNDIESVEVLKDASSAAIYGARGANGVILVTTQRGGNTQGRSRITYAGSVSVNTMARYMDVMDSDMWMAAFKEGLENANRWQGTNFNTDLAGIFTDQRFFNNGVPRYSTDWQREMTRTAISHNHQLSITRGGSDHSAGAFFNFTDEQAILLNSWQKRVNARFVFDDRPVRWLSTQNNLTVNHSWNNRLSDNPYGQGPLRTMIEQLPFLPVKYDGRFMQSSDALNTTSIPRNQNNPGGAHNSFGPEGMGNPVELATRDVRSQFRTQIHGSMALIFHFSPNLQFRTQYGTEYRINLNEGFNPIDPPIVEGGPPRHIIGLNAQGMAARRQDNIWNWQQENFMTWSPRFDRHSINGMVGAAWSQMISKHFGVRQVGTGGNFFGIYSLGRGTERPDFNDDWPVASHNAWTMNSYFTRWSYGFDGKYNAQLTARIDGSSRLGANNKYGLFPAAGVGWTISNEEFMQDIQAISRLKLRSSYGITGNSEITTYQSLAAMAQSTTLVNNQTIQFANQNRMGNADLRWERTATWDLGLEVGLFNDRFNFEGSFYHRYTSDLLLNAPIPRHSGFEAVMQNVGEMSNRGVDLMITASPVSTPNFTWSSTLNTNWNRNRVERLDPMSAVDPRSGAREMLVDGFTGYSMLIREGEPTSTFYGHRRLGIFCGDRSKWPSDDQAIVPTVTGQRVITRDRYILGNGLPDWMGSLINTFSYKGFDLTVDLQFSLGADVMQEFFHSAEARFHTSGITQLYTNAWHPERNPTGTGQAIRLSNFGMGNDANADDTWVTSGNFLRGNLIQLGYTFQPKTLGSLNLSALRVFTNVNNAFLIKSKGFLGYDPDNSTRLGNNNWGANRQFFSYPRAMTFTLGLNVTL